MIKYTTGNIFESNCDCLINTVNCEGYMGKGIAYQFKLQFPKMNRDYIKACNDKTLTIGKLHYYIENNITIVNFPTKNKWRENSKLSYIEIGLDELIRLLPKLNIKSIAVPPLGCGNGGLSWEEVKPIIDNKLSKLSEVYDIIVYEPSKNYVAKAKEAPKLNTSSLVLMEYKKGLTKFNTLRIQKTAFFMNYFANEEYFHFQKHKFGPYDNSINIISKEIKAFQNYYGTSNIDDTYAIAYNVLVSNKTNEKINSLKPHIKSAINYVNKIQNDKRLEGIATVLFLIQNNIYTTEKEITTAFMSWSEDKAARFSEKYILDCLEYLLKTNVVVKSMLGFKIL